MRASEVGQSRADDNEILQKAISEYRILVTLDEHFGDWVILPLSKHPGVIRLKINPATSENAMELLIPFLCLHSPEQFGWLARYVKEVDASELTLRFYQEIYDDFGQLVEVHEKYPIDKGHEKIGEVSSHED